MPLLLVNIYFIQVKKERGMLSNFSTISILSLGVVASGYLSLGGFGNKLWLAWLFCVIFFMGSVFFVKTMLRERRNISYKYLSWSYHLMILIILSIISGSGLLLVAYLPSMVRAFICYGRSLTQLAIGKIEIINSTIFTICLIIYF
ncbi:hypothetical protein N752_21710 [Desulforamulus aquiferis]|nr:hypothetical protein N752_21710 [Desulforamulus aquiferis]